MRLTQQIKNKFRKYSNQKLVDRINKKEKQADTKGTKPNIADEGYELERRINNSDLRVQRQGDDLVITNQ